MLKKLRWLGLGVVMGSASLCAATLSGEAIEVASDVVHPNGNVYDQVLMRGAFATVRADPGQVMRISFVGLTDDIVQVEFSGKGLLSIFLADASGPAPAVKYNQPGVDYMRGHASLRIDGPDATTNLSVFSVGRLTAVNQALFRSDVPYDGFADLAVVEIEPDPAALAGPAST